MAFYPVTHGVQVRVVGVLSDAHTWNNVLWFDYSTVALDQAGADSLSDLVSDAYSNFITYWHTGTFLNEVVVTDMRTEGAPQFVSTSSLPIVGTAGDNPLPSQTAGLMTWLTGFRGKAGRGRSYIPGFTEAGSSGDSPVAGLAAKFALFGGAITADNWAVAHRFSGASTATKGSRRLKPTPLATGVLNLITDYRAAPAWATQRRRAVRV